MNSSVAALMCAISLAVGQVLFKATALSLAQANSTVSLKALMWFAAAMVVYGITSLAWVMVLRGAELGKVYPIMALAFVFVPVASYLFFGERFSTRYVFGVALIVVGIVLANQG